jgi:hypothetical protein
MLYRFSMTRQVRQPGAQLTASLPLSLPESSSSSLGAFFRFAAVAAGTAESVLLAGMALCPCLQGDMPDDEVVAVTEHKVKFKLYKGLSEA